MKFHNLIEILDQSGVVSLRRFLSKRTWEITTFVLNEVERKTTHYYNKIFKIESCITNSQFPMLFTFLHFIISSCILKYIDKYLYSIFEIGFFVVLPVVHNIIIWYQDVSCFYLVYSLSWTIKSSPLIFATGY